MKVELIDWPRDLIGTFAKVWAMSKTNGDWRNAQPNTEEFLRVLEAEVPVLRFANFTWIIEDMPVFFREQLVRAKHEDFWIQSMRIANFKDEGIHTYDFPSIEEVDLALYAIEKAYNAILEEGYPEEMARRILPLATIHRGAWFTNLQALLTRFKKRSCWVAEDLWVDVLHQVARELVDKVHPVFQGIITPPCFARGSSQYRGCTINEIMKHRDEGKDPLPLCPLWAHHNDRPCVLGDNRASKFAGLWQRDPYTGTPVS